MKKSNFYVIAIILEIILFNVLVVFSEANGETISACIFFGIVLILAIIIDKLNRN